MAEQEGGSLHIPKLPLGPQPCLPSESSIAPLHAGRSDIFAILVLTQTPGKASAGLEGKHSEGSSGPVPRFSRVAWVPPARRDPRTCARVAGAKPKPPRYAAGLKGPSVQPAPALLVPKRQVGILAPPPGCESNSTT